MKIETVRYQLDWLRFRKGRSFFVPCIDTEAARTHVEKVMKRLKVKVVTKVVIEDGVKGLRVWRI